MIELNKGTVEELLIPVKDITGTITTLDLADPHFNIYSDDDSNDAVVADAVASNDGMTAICLVDTTDILFTSRTYRLYLTLTAMPDVPILGPFNFRVNSL